MRSSIFRSAFAAAALAFGVAGAEAGTATGTLSVTATVVSVCEVTPVLPVAFASILSTNNTALNAVPGSILVTCDTGHGYTLDLGNGNHYSGSYRQMAGTLSSSHLLTYQLYTSNSYSTIWGSQAGGTTVSSTGTGIAQTFSVYGQIPTSANFVTDQYSDSITVTLTY
ncbi:MAG: spore coat U domain-containing protein [Rhodomicrobium sp.]